MTLGDFIRIKRKELEMTQADFEKKSGISPRQLRRYEHDQTTLKLDKVARIFVNLGIELTLSKPKDELQEETKK